MPPVTDAVLAIPLGTRDLVRQALDLLTRADAGLRSASFYIGFMLLVTVGPALILSGIALTLPAGEGFGPADEPSAWFGWLFLAGIPAVLGYFAVVTEARALATAVIGGRVEGRPLRLRESISVSRHRFWHVLAGQLLVGVLAGTVSFVVQFAVLVALGQAEVLTTGFSLLISLIVGVPFAYVPSGIVLGEVPVVEAISRSFRLIRLRKRLAIVITLFAVVSQFIVLFGIGAGADVIGRLAVGSGIVDDFPMPLVVPIAAVIAFAMGTLMFLVEAIAAAPAVHAFEALTHYTHGLEVGRREPVAGTSPWDPWVTPGLALAGLVGLVALLGGLLTFPA
jgi:hypothetical protein